MEEADESKVFTIERESEHRKSFCFKFISSFTVDKYMLPCKLCYFFAVAKTASLTPYMLPFLIGMGLSPDEAGLIGGVRLIGMVVGGPFWGFIADRRQNQMSIVLILIGASLLLIGGQPLVSIVAGDKEINVCPSNTMVLTNTTANNDTLTATTGKMSFVSTGFFVMLFLNITATFFDGSIMGLIDSGVSHRINNATKPRDFGRNRLFGTLGFAFGSLFAGILSDYFPSASVNCFTGAYVAYGLGLLALAVPSWYLFHSTLEECPRELPMKKKKKTVKIRKELIRTLKDFDVIMFFLTLFFIGIFDTIHGSFSSLRLQELKASSLLIGLSYSVASLSCIPFMIFSSKLIDLFQGIWGAIIVSCVSFVIRFLAFAYIQNPWMALPVNLLDGFNGGLVLVAMVVNVQSISEPKIYTTMLSIMNCIYYGAACITGNIVGGFVISKYKGYGLFLAFGVLAAIWFVVLVIYRILKRMSAAYKQVEQGESSSG